MWLTLGFAFIGAICGALGWTVCAFLGTPIRRFLDLRGEVIRRLTEFANVLAQYKEIRDSDGKVERLELSDDDSARLEVAKRVLRDLGSQMRAFAHNEPPAMWLVRHLRYDPTAASAGLIGLSNRYDTYGFERARHRQTVEIALRIKPSTAHLPELQS
jgi:hypothetical protein